MKILNIPANRHKTKPTWTSGDLGIFHCWSIVVGAPYCLYCVSLFQLFMPGYCPWLGATLLGKLFIPPGSELLVVLLYTGIGNVCCPCCCWGTGEGKLWPIGGNNPPLEKGLFVLDNEVFWKVLLAGTAAAGATLVGCESPISTNIELASVPTLVAGMPLEERDAVASLAIWRPEISTNEFPEGDTLFVGDTLFILAKGEAILGAEFSDVVAGKALGWRTFLSSSMSFIVCNSTSSNGVEVSPSKSEISNAFLPFPPKLSFFLCPNPGATTGWRISLPTLEKTELWFVAVSVVSTDVLVTWASVEEISGCSCFEAFSASDLETTSSSRLKSY